CFSPDPQASLSTVSPQRMRTIVEAWADRTAALSQLEGIAQVYCFENHGAEIGVTLHHPHGQIYAYPMVTPRTEQMLQQAVAHRQRTGRNLLRDVLEAELAPAGGSWPRASTGSPTCPPPPAGPWRCTWRPGGTCRTCRPPRMPNAPTSPSSTSRCCSAWTATSWPRTARRCRCPIFPVGTRHPCTKAATTCGCTCSCSPCAAPPISSSTWP